MRSSALTPRSNTYRCSIDTEADLEKLIIKTETDGGDRPAENTRNLFSFARVWSANKDDLEDLNEDEGDPSAEADSWAQTLAKIASQKEAATQVVEASGRGVRRKATMARKAREIAVESEHY